MSQDEAGVLSTGEYPFSIRKTQLVYCQPNRINGCLLARSFDLRLQS
jgi:hypothetical protein